MGRRPGSHIRNPLRGPVSSSVSSWLNFNPLSLIPALWLDASDITTITESGGSVSQWNDKSGNGYQAVQATGAAQPTTGSTTQNGLNVLSFDGNDGLSISSFNMTGGGQTLSVWAVFSCVSGGDRVVMEQSTNYNSNPGSFLLLRNSLNVVSVGRNQAPGTENYSTFATTGTVTTTPRTFVATFDGTLTTNEWSGFLAGDGSGTRPLNNDTNANNINANLFIGSRANTAVFLSGSICEIGVCLKPLTTGERLALELYLAKKWAVS